MKALNRSLARFHGLFTKRRDERRLAEELEQHLAMAIEDNLRAGLSEAEANRQAKLTFGSVQATVEAYRDQRTLRWLESLASDAVSGWRQLKKHRTASASAGLSLALATGASIAAFQIMDALLWRPLPVKNPEQLYVLARAGIGYDGKPTDMTTWTYPSFQRMRDAVQGETELLAVSHSGRMDITYHSDQEMEKANLQYVSGSLFRSFGLNPALGRLLTEDDDRKTGSHPYAVLSNDYWVRRLGSDPQVVGRTFRYGDRVFEIVGVAPERFIGTDPGLPIDIFLPAMMHPGADRDDAVWHRTLARVPPGASLEPLRQKLEAISRGFERERMERAIGSSKRGVDWLTKMTLSLRPAASGVSPLQRTYRQSLLVLALLVILILLITCVNLANLMTVRAASRAREMALRVSIGAGRWRLIQMALVESAILAFVGISAGTMFAAWAAPVVVGQINHADTPVRLALLVDMRVLAFGVLLTFGVVLSLGLIPALRAAGVDPITALKGGENPQSRRRGMHTLIAVQVAFCFLVLFLAGVFASTLERLSNRPLGFSAERILNIETIAQRGQSPVFWHQLGDRLRATPGVESVSLASSALLGGMSSNSFISIKGQPANPNPAYFHNIAPEWLRVMKIPLIDGRDFRPGDSSPGAAIVNEAFAREYFNGENPIGRSFARNERSSYQIVGLVKDSPYRSLREPILPVAYLPFQTVDASGTPHPIRFGRFIVRTIADDPLPLAAALRREIAQARPDFRVSEIVTQKELVLAQTVRERLLAMLAIFFAAVAALLAGIGLYGVLDYSVLQRRREIGIRLAIGAQGTQIASLVTKEVLSMVFLGAAVGLGLGLASGQYIESLLYQVKVTDINILAIPSLTVLAVALLAALAPVLRAVRIDPVAMLRAE